MVLQHIKSISLQLVNGIYAILFSVCIKTREVFKMHDAAYFAILLTL